MWTRESLKTDAKATLKTCFGNSILVCLIISLVSGFGSSASSFANNMDYSHFSLEQLIALLGFMTFASIISIALSIFVTAILSVGAIHFFLSSRVKPAVVDMIGFGFKKGRYGNVCKTMFFMNLFVFLWSLLFIIPGIYKGYQYRMVPYLLAENPQMDYKRALDLSKAMMDGQKLDTFVLDLSFVGWYLLSVFTCGILAIVYVAPYQNHTNAGLYIALRQNAINSGLVNPAELYAVVDDMQPM